MMDWRFACPVCQQELSPQGAETLACAGCNRVFRCEAGIWRLLPEARLAAYARFAREYETVRRAEGRGAETSEYYRALPFSDLSGQMRGDWAIRARSYTALVERVIPAESLRILDLGAGNGWLSNRLAGRGHCLAAVDLLVNDFDGLGACRHYPAKFTPVQAEFDALPFVEAQADLVIFNASFHYATRYEITLSEALRVVQPGGWVVILDSPIYHDPVSGEQMVREREAQFARKYGFASNALASENYLTEKRLRELEAGLGIRWQVVLPRYGVRWRLRPWLAKLRGGREPARFEILAARREEAG